MENAGGGDWYETPIYYDIIFDQDTSEEVDFVEAAARQHGLAAKKRWRTLEPACGSGRFMVELARRGHKVTGFDLEPAMVEFTRRRLKEAGLPGRVEAGRMERFDLGEGKFDVAHCFVSTFKYVLSERGARSHLRHVARHLRTGGLYLLGFHLTDYQSLKPAVEKWRGSRGDKVVDCTISSDAPDPELRLERVRSTLKVREGSRRKLLASEWDFRTYDARQVRAMLRAVPEFELTACYDFQYDLEQERELDDPWEDVILVLKRVR